MKLIFSRAVLNSFLNTNNTLPARKVKFITLKAKTPTFTPVAHARRLFYRMCTLGILGGSRLIKSTTPLLGQWACSPLTENLMASTFPINTLLHSFPASF